MLTTNEAALQLYRRHGFSPQRHERNFYVIRGPCAPVPGKARAPALSGCFSCVSLTQTRLLQVHYDAFALCHYVNGGRPSAGVLSALGAAESLLRRFWHVHLARLLRCWSPRSASGSER